MHRMKEQSSTFEIRIVVEQTDAILIVVMFTHTAGASVDMNPEECWMGCYEMYSRTWILIGLSETKEGKVICFCSPQADNFPSVGIIDPCMS